MDLQDLLTRLTGKHVVVRKMDRDREFNLVGLLLDVGDGHIFLANPEKGDRIILISEILDVKEDVTRRGAF